MATGGVHIPYTISNPPDAVKGLPKGAQAIFIAAFNAAIEQYNGDEGKAFPVAWAAVKTKYKQLGTNWVAKEASERLAINLEDRADVLLIPDFVSIVGAVAKQGHGDTLDVLFRQKDEDDGLVLQVKKALVGGAADIRPIWNAAGPHGTHLPLYDLVLRATKANRRRILDGAKSPYRFPAPEETQKENGGDMTFEAFKASDELQTVWGVVMLPNVPDTQKQAFPQEAIRKAIHNFNALTLTKASKVVRLQHRKPIDAQVVESYQTPSEVKYDGQVVPAGSWVMAIKINDPEVWKLVKAGKLTGLSPRIIWRTGAEHPIKREVRENHVQQAT